tara:strand:- start:4927 stop:5688 length:762 start_codon:yes stop_codon:yes gene_type:complete
MSWPAEFGGLETSLLVILVLVAGIVRGYTGFGLSAVAITIGSIVFSPLALVPVLYLIEIVASVHMLKSVHRDIDRPLLFGLLIGCAIGMPAGQELLLWLPVDATRMALYLIVIFAAAIVRFGYVFRIEANWRTGIAIGIAAGLASGLAAIGGLITMIALLGIAYDVVRARATMVAMFFVLYVYGTGIGVMNGITTSSSLIIAGALVLPLFLGVALGQKGFLRTSPERFRQIMLGFLAVMAAGGILRVGLGGGL